jgi:hypothetical protein
MWWLRLLEPFASGTATATSPFKARLRQWGGPYLRIFHKICEAPLAGWRWPSLGPAPTPHGPPRRRSRPRPTASSHLTGIKASIKVMQFHQSYDRMLLRGASDLPLIPLHLIAIMLRVALTNSSKAKGNRIHARPHQPG